MLVHKPRFTPPLNPHGGVIYFFKDNADLSTYVEAAESLDDAGCPDEQPMRACRRIAHHAEYAG